MGKEEKELSGFSFSLVTLLIFIIAKEMDLNWLAKFYTANVREPETLMDTNELNTKGRLHVDYSCPMGTNSCSFVSIFAPHGKRKRRYTIDAAAPGY